MSKLRRFAIAGIGALLITQPALPAEQIGKAVSIRTTVTGQGGPLAAADPVYRDERIRTSSSGLGEFIFRDGTKFVVGWGSSLALDSFVFDDAKSAKKFTVKAAKGTFRWISGSSKSSAYEIKTAAGTLGIRGTAFDFYVGANGTTAVVLLSGSVRFCGRNGCRELHRRCDVIVATPAGGVSEPRRVSRDIFRALGNGRALPFLSGNQKVSRQFQVRGSDCGLSMASLDPTEKGTRQKLDPGRPSRTRAAGPDPAPDPDPPPGPDPDPPPGPDPDPPPGPDPDPPAAGKQKHANNGKGNGGGDGSPNGRNDKDR